MDLAIPCGIGAGVATGVFILGRVAGFDRDRAFYSTILIVIASYYILFAVLGRSTHALVVESLIFAVFLAAAVAGFRSSLWIVALGLVLHGVMDFFFHDRLVQNPGLPPWWPWFCGGYDVAAGAFLGWLIRREKSRA